jgi:hypothetical protein
MNLSMSLSDLSYIGVLDFLLLRITKKMIAAVMIATIIKSIGIPMPNKEGCPLPVLDELPPPNNPKKF